jgi:hypothetical protein
MSAILWVGAISVLEIGLSKMDGEWYCGEADFSD